MAVGPYPRRIVAKKAAYTIEVRKDRSGTIFTNRGAAGTVTFTLPKASKYNLGTEYWFVGMVAFTLVVQSANSTGILTFNNNAATSLTYSTAGNQIGVRVHAVSDGTQWLVNQATSNATVTVA